MIKPREDDIGKRVIYREPNNYPGRKTEVGILSSFNNQFAFVIYHPGSTPKATRFEDLEWDTSNTSDLLWT
jgi:hypothetical protein